MSNQELLAKLEEQRKVLNDRHSQAGDESETEQEDILSSELEAKDNEISALQEKIAQDEEASNQQQESNHEEVADNIQSEVVSPLDQFMINDLFSLNTPLIGNLHVSITNIGLYLMLGAFFILALSLLSTNFNKLVANK